jgi:transcriptional regulator NrdR family protein
MSYAEEIERKVIGKIGAIKRGEVDPQDSGIAVLFNKLKDLDEVAYATNIAEYKKVLDARKAEQNKKK